MEEFGVFVVLLILLIWFLVLICIAVGVAMYILRALAYRKAMRLLHYRKSWMAWIPFAQHYALADAASEGAPTMKLFNADCPVWFFKFWFLMSYALSVFPFGGAIAGFIYRLFFQGSVFRTAYAKIENRSLGSRTAIGFFSTIIELIPIIKFLSYNSPAEPEKAVPAPTYARPVTPSEAVTGQATAAPVYQPPVPAQPPVPYQAPAAEAPVSAPAAPALESTAAAAPEAVQEAASAVSEAAETVSEAAEEGSAEKPEAAAENPEIQE